MSRTSICVICFIIIIIIIIIIIMAVECYKMLVLVGHPVCDGQFCVSG
jgi:hypothetical protein